MIAGLDSSFDRPNLAQAQAAYAAGVRLWGGYIGTRPGLGLATLWSQADFDVVRHAGMRAIAYASGFDDPVAVRAMAESWGVLLGVDVEPGIRPDGPWVMGWVTAAGAGLYGLASVHYAPGEPIGRGAAWNVMANYPGFDPQATWIGGLTPPAGPHGWQWQGTHTEFGLSVDRMWLDDSLGPQISTGGAMGALIYAPPVVNAGRADLFYVDATGHVAYVFSDGGAGGLDALPAGSGAQVDAAGTPVGGFTTAGLSASWDNIQRRNVIAQDAAGNVYLAVLNLDGSLAQGWTKLAIGALSAAPVGPHRHDVTLSGTSGLPKP